MQREQSTNARGIVIRGASETDFPAIARLITNPDELFWVFPAASWPLNVRQIHRLSEQRMDLTVGNINDNVVAFANLYNVLPGKSAFIGNIVVHEAQRGHGIGHDLLRHMLNLIFVKRALPEAHISVFSENTSALRLYKAIGFTEYDRESRKDPQSREVTLLHLKLVQTQ